MRRRGDGAASGAGVYGGGNSSSNTGGGGTGDGAGPALRPYNPVVRPPKGPPPVVPKLDFSTLNRIV